MLAERICRGVLQRDDGLLVARGVSLSMVSDAEQTGLADVRGTICVFDDPAFARRYTQKRFVFVSAFDPEDKIDVFILDANGACIAFPLASK